MKKRRIFLCIGGNLGDREENLEETRMFLEFNFGDIVMTSSIYETEPWGMQDVPAFLNQVICLESSLSNKELITEIAELEEFYGRERSQASYLSREMDVDLLFIDDEVIEEENLVVPHPRIQLRKFVLVPMNEIAPDYLHPQLGKTIKELLASCEDAGSVKKI